MLDPLGHHEHLTGTEGDVSVAHLNGHSSLEHEEEVVCVVVLVPNKRPLHFDYHQVVAIELTNRSWLPMLRKAREFVREVNSLHSCLLLSMAAALLVTVTC